MWLSQYNTTASTQLFFLRMVKYWDFERHIAVQSLQNLLLRILAFLLGYWDFELYPGVRHYYYFLLRILAFLLGYWDFEL